MVNPCVDGYTVLKPQINRNTPKNAKRPHRTKKLLNGY